MGQLSAAAACLLATLIVAVCATPITTTNVSCGVRNEVKLYRTPLGTSKVGSQGVFYLPTPGKTINEDEDFLLLLSEDHQLYLSTDGGVSFEKQNPMMLHANESLPPIQQVKGVREVTWAHDGSVVYATSYTWGFWRKQTAQAWEWLASTDFPLQVITHPQDSNVLAISFVTPGCWNSSAGICQRPLRISRDRGSTFTELSKQVIQFFWSTATTSAPYTLFYSEHYEANTNFYSQDWYHSKLYSISIGATGTLSSAKMLVDHESGSLYRNGSLLAAVRVSQDSEKVYLVTSTDEGATINKAIFREWVDDELEAATSFNILEFNGGSIFINVRKDLMDRGDLYLSGAFDHDFNLVLTDNVRRGAYADVAHLGSVRGIYIANVWAGYAPNEGTEEDENPTEEETSDPQDEDPPARRLAQLRSPKRQLTFQQAMNKKRTTNGKAKRQQTPEPEQQVTGITYDNGGNWDFIAVPSDLKSQCPADADWCGLHFLGRSDSDIGQSPFAPRGAVGISLATGNVGQYLDRNPEALNTFLTRDAGVTWTKIADGDNHYQVCDRGGVIAWLSATHESSDLTWSWDEGGSHSSCSFGALGSMSTHGMVTSPSRDGLRIHLLGSTGSEQGATVQYYVTTVDFTSLAALKCGPADYELWSPKDPDGTQGCLLGSITTYKRRKANTQCFNVDNDSVQNSSNCKCEEDDYECDDCYRRETFWDPKSACIPDDRHTCEPQPNPCGNHEATYLATRGYKKVPFDTCISDTTDVWQPNIMNCKDGTPAPTTTHSTTPPTPTTSPTAPPTTSHRPPTPSPVGPPTTRPPTAPPTQTPTTNPTASGDRSSNAPLIAGVIIVLLLAGLVGGFFVLRRNARFQTWANGRFPAWLVPTPEEPYSTLGELEAPSSLDEDF